MQGQEATDRAKQREAGRENPWGKSEEGRMGREGTAPGSQHFYPDPTWLALGFLRLAVVSLKQALL